jgi:hypothetical protein
MPSPAKAMTVPRVRPLPCSPPYAGYLHNAHAGHWFNYARIVHSVEDIPLVRQEAFPRSLHVSIARRRPAVSRPTAWPPRLGMARAKAKGKRIGRPAINPDLQREIADRVATGSSAYRVAGDLGLDRKPVAKHAATILKGPQETSWAISVCQR